MSNVIERKLVYLLPISALALAAHSALGLQITSSSGNVQMGTFNVTGATAAASTPIFGTTAMIGGGGVTNPVLVSVGNGYNAAGAAAGNLAPIVNPGGGANGDVVFNNVGGQINTGIRQIPNAPNNVSTGAVNFSPVGYVGGDVLNSGGGVAWGPTTKVVDGTGNGMGTFNISNETVGLQNGTGNNYTQNLQAGIGYAFSGPLPAGNAESEFAISASYTINGGARVFLNPIVFGIINPFAGGNGNGLSSFASIVSQNANGTTANVVTTTFAAPGGGIAALPTAKPGTTAAYRTNDVGGDNRVGLQFVNFGGGNVKWYAYGLSNGALVNVPVGFNASVTATLTLIGDPQDEADLDSDSFPTDLQLPSFDDDTSDQSQVPEPASLSLLAAGSGLLMARRRRHA